MSANKPNTTKVVLDGFPKGVRVSSREFEEQVQAAVEKGARTLTVKAQGQHGIGGRLWPRDKKIKITKKEVENISSIFKDVKKGYFKKDIASLDAAQRKFHTLSRSTTINDYIFLISRSLYGFSNSVLKII